MTRKLFFFTIFFLGLSFVASAEAYIGPGAGFAFLSSFLVLAISFVMAIFSLLFWPFRLLAKKLLRRKSRPHGETERVIILGLDGLDPGLTEKFMAEGAAAVRAIVSNGRSTHPRLKCQRGTLTNTERDRRT